MDNIRIRQFIEKGNEIETKDNEQRELDKKNGVYKTEPISGREYGLWMKSLKIFIDNELKTHPLYKTMNNAYVFRDNIKSSFYDMMDCLQVLFEEENIQGMVMMDSLVNKILIKDSPMDTTDVPNTDMMSTESVFIVHGHDNEAKEVTARVLEKLGLKPIILHEQVSNGDTIIEKFERCTEVAFAVVLYTPCDEGNSKKDTTPKNRARQNVVFEHGYLMAKLGRKRVCALVKGNIETPSDITGVVYVPMDDRGAWKYTLIEEMKMVGIKLDKNKIN